MQAGQKPLAEIVPFQNNDAELPSGASYAITLSPQGSFQNVIRPDAYTGSLSTRLYVDPGLTISLSAQRSAALHKKSEWRQLGNRER